MGIGNTRTSVQRDLMGGVIGSRHRDRSQARSARQERCRETHILCLEEGVQCQDAVEGEGVTFPCTRTNCANGI